MPPYAGLGIAYTFNNLNQTGIFETSLTGVREFYNQAKGSLACRGILGVAHPSSAVPAATSRSRPSAKATPWSPPQTMSASR